ncbi:hypothetical protein [Clostridium manihotivorum]|uniref:Uncharacterized protein n=1 Tax=Clostridium manihotivorum TaxID=2320868 RepID=A0A3R5V4Z2_9CLOT|nr:hypothetical protein [Clostridium manihotivorum]QAA30322.1 hypothetical protein C1I91_00720 [Clostridium manihotivorum]
MSYSREEMLRNNYETDNDYILDVLKEADDKIFSDMYGMIPEGNLLDLFRKWLSIRNKIEDIYIEQAYSNGFNAGAELARVQKRRGQ